MWSFRRCSIEERIFYGLQNSCGRPAARWMFWVAYERGTFGTLSSKIQCVNLEKLFLKYCFWQRQVLSILDRDFRYRWPTSKAELAITQLEMVPIPIRIGYGNIRDAVPSPNAFLRFWVWPETEVLVTAGAIGNCGISISDMWTRRWNNNLWAILRFIRGLNRFSRRRASRDHTQYSRLQLYYWWPWEISCHAASEAILLNSPHNRRRSIYS